MCHQVLWFYSRRSCCLYGSDVVCEGISRASHLWNSFCKFYCLGSCGRRVRSSPFYVWNSRFLVTRTFACGSGQSRHCSFSHGVLSFFSSNSTCVCNGPSCSHPFRYLWTLGCFLSCSVASRKCAAIFYLL